MTRKTGVTLAICLGVIVAGSCITTRASTATGTDAGAGPNTGAGATASANADDPAWAFPPSDPRNGSPDTAKDQKLPGSDQVYSHYDLLDRTRAVDWFPDTHPPMPAAVKGTSSAYACGYCHYPQGIGRTENADLAGMPLDYLQRQVQEMKSGARTLIDPRFVPGELMSTAINGNSDSDIDAALRYYSALKYVKHVRVVEATRIPRTKADGYLYFFDTTGATEALGLRIIEGPDDHDAFEKRDPRTHFTAYVPKGAIARGAALAGGNGSARPPCTLCHGEGLRGGPLGPPIAGRFPTGLFRQLYAFQKGTRNGTQAQLMKPIVASLTQRQMIDLAAYVGSLQP
jgi:cytochrome c553